MLRRVKGTKDVPPEEQIRYENIRETSKRLFQLYGFSQIRVPAIEYSEIYEKKSGDEILEKMFEFKDRSQDTICLRPDLTASVARAYINEWRLFPKPLKLWYSGPAYRYDEPQRGRYREFYHVGVEFIGADSPVADAELISLAVDILRNLQLKRWRLRLGHIGFFLAYLDQIRKKIIGQAINEYEQEMVMDYLQARLISRSDRQGKVREIEKTFEKDGLESAYYKPATNFLFELTKLKGSRDKILPKLERLCEKHNLPLMLYDNLKQIIALLNRFGVVGPEEISLDMGITRGLTYYTGMVFEIDVPALGSQKQVCGGGRYDRLIEILGGNIESTPAAGFAFGLERLGLALISEKKVQKVEAPVDVFVAYVSEDVLDYAIRVLQDIRRTGIRANMEYRRRKVSESLSYASNANIPYVLVVGPKEKMDESVTLRDMFAKKESTLSLERALQMLRKETTLVNNVEG